MNVSGSSNMQPNSSDPFDRFDIVETSLHFNIKRLDVHIIADSDVLSTLLHENLSFRSKFFPFSQNLIFD